MWTIHFSWLCCATSAMIMCFFFWLTSPVTPRRRMGTPTDAAAVMTAHRLLSSAMRSDDDILDVVLHDLRSLRLWRLPSTVLVVWSSAAYHDDKHGWTMITWNAWRLTVKAPDVRRGHWPVATFHTYSFLLCSLYDMPIIFLALNWKSIQLKVQLS